MSHPTVETMLAGDARSHVARCETCRRLAKLLGVAVTSDDLDRLPPVDDAVYTDWSELAEGRGGMGSIFRARDRRLGRFVAIKQLRMDLEVTERATLRGRFEREARLTARLQHPAIVGVHEAGQFATGEPFYAMPLLRGVPLSREIEQRATIAERLGLLPHLTTVAEAVAYAHGEGIVHRDIKPDNILIGTFGETVLIDWGLAKDLADTTADDGVYREAPHDGLTQLGVGTPQYMPPEQARGAAPDPRVDIYALGATLYHALAGRPPYGDARATEVRRELAHAPPEPLPEEVPRELVDIVERAMARDPETRFASAQGLADELRRYQTGQLLTTRRYTVAELLRHFARRYRVALRIAAVALVAVAVLAVIAVLRISRERDRAETAQLRAERELRRAQGTIASARAADPAQRMDALLLGVNALRPELSAGEPPVPEAWQGVIDALAAGPPLLPLPHTGVIKDLARAGDTLIGVDDALALLVWDAGSAKQLARYPISIPSPHRVIVSPDARHAVVFGFDRAADVFELATGKRGTFQTTKTLIAAAFLPDGRLVAVAEDVTVRDPATLAIVERFSLPAPAASLQIGPHGEVAVPTIEKPLWLWKSGATPRVHVLPAQGLFLDFDGTTMLITGIDQLVRAVDFDTLVETTVHTETTQRLGHTLASPDRRFLAIARFDLDKTRSSIIIDRTAKRSFAIDGISNQWASTSWLLVDGYGRGRVVDAETEGTVLELRAHATEASFWAMQDHLGTASRDGTAYLWDLQRGFASGMLLGPTGEIVALETRGASVMAASRDGTVHVWRDGAPIVIRGNAELLHAAWVGNDAIVTGDLAGRVRIVELTGRERAAFAITAPISALAVAGSTIACGALDGTLRIADRVIPTRSAVTALALDGDRLISAHADGSTRSWSRTGTLLARVDDREPLEQADDHDGHAALAFQGDRILAARPAGSTIVFDRELREQQRLDGRVVAIDGSRIATAALDGSVTIHDGTVQRRLVGHRSVVLAAAWSEQILATASADTIRIWDVASGTTQLEIRPQLGTVTALAFRSPDELVAGHDSGAVRVYPVTPRATLARACAVLARAGRSCN